MGQAKKQAQMIGGDYLVNTNGGTMLRRIRAPHPHDVLCGRGGGINSHIGNRVFRDWVAERRLDYNLASTKSDKARVAKEVINRVARQTPPGRFLQRDTSGGVGSFWVEVAEDRAMAKTSQALREGAPTIRAQHHTDENLTSQSPTHRMRPREDSPESPTTNPTLIPYPLMSNSDFEKEFSRPAKIMKIDPDDTPTLLPASGSEIPRLSLEATLSAVVTPTITSTSPSDYFHECTWSLDGGGLDEFVNPFEDEEAALELYEKALEMDQAFNVYSQ